MVNTADEDGYELIRTVPPFRDHTLRQLGLVPSNLVPRPNNVLIIQRPSKSRFIHGLPKLIVALQSHGATVQVLCPDGGGINGPSDGASDVNSDAAGAGGRTMLEDLNYHQQFSLFARQSFIIAAHGAALANLAFCDPLNCQGVEVMPLQLVSLVAGRWYQSLPVRVHPVGVKSAESPLPLNGMLVRNLRASAIELDTPTVDRIVALWCRRLVGLNCLP